MFPNDDTGPTPAFRNDGRTYMNPPRIEVVVTDAWPGLLNGNLVELDVDGDGFDDGEGFTGGDGVAAIRINHPLSDGAYNVRAQVTDLAGNQATTPPPWLTIELDTASPSTTFLLQPDTGVPGDLWTNDPQPTFLGTASDASPFNGPWDVSGLPVAIDLECDGVVDMQTVTGYGGPWSVQPAQPLADGRHSACLRLSDQAGNEFTLRIDFFFVDTVAPPRPVISGIDQDTGTVGDGVTSDNTLRIFGTAEPNSTVRVYEWLYFGGQVGDDLTADPFGNWVLDVTDQNLPDRAYQFTATATDLAGNVSDPSLPFYVLVDSDIFPAVTKPDLEAASDTGQYDDDNITRDTTPAFEGQSEPGSLVALYADTAQGTILLGTVMTGTFGTWSLTASLPAGLYEVWAQATDAAGNQADSTALAVRIDTTAPYARRVTPGGPLVSEDINYIEVQFSEQMDSDRATDPASYRLVGDRVGNVPLLPVLLGGDQLVRLYRQGGKPFANDRYRLTLEADRLRDVAGNEFDGNEDGVGGDDKTITFTKDISPGPPTITDIRLFGNARVTTVITISFSEDMVVREANNARFYRLTNSGRDGIFGTADDIEITDFMVRYRKPLKQVVLRSQRGFINDRLFQLAIDGMLSAEAGENSSQRDLDGNQDGLGGDGFRALIGRGKRLAYLDPEDGDIVTLRLQRNGFIELVRGITTDKVSVHLQQTLSDSVLYGSVRMVPGGNGRTRIDKFGVDPGRLFKSRLRRPPFTVGPLPADVVDRLIEQSQGTMQRARPANTGVLLVEP